MEKAVSYNQKYDLFWADIQIYVPLTSFFGKSREVK